MNKEFLQEFMTRTAFPEEAAAQLLRDAETVQEKNCTDRFDSAVSFYADNDFSTELTEPMVEEVAAASGLSPYAVWMLLLIEAARPQLLTCRELGTGEELFWDTFSDLRYKALECKEIHGVWGTFVAFWYPIFYTGDIVKLGRLEYENGSFQGKEPYVKNGVAVNPGDFVLNVHIPSSGEPFHREARLSSYRKAYAHFEEQLGGGPLVCVCHSWLLNPDYAKFLPPDSNFVDFQRDFALIEAEQEREFEDAWRLFGRDYQKPAPQLPERTSMQRAFKNYFLKGGVPGCGRGILIFDGEKLLS